MNQNEKKIKVAEEALQYIESGCVLGVGSGTTVNCFIEQLSKIKSKIDAVVSASESSSKLLISKNIRVISLKEAGRIPIYIDGADESNSLKQLIKGGGGALTREKILAQSKAYQSLVDQFEDKRRKQRNIITKQEDQIRDQESELIKQKNVLSKEVYAEKVKSLNKKINDIKQKNMAEAKKFEVLFEKSTNKIQGALVDVLSVIANDANLNLVLAKSQVILVGKDIDLTEKAVIELNKVLPKVTLGEN